MAKLIKIIDYSLAGKQYQPNPNQIQIIADNPTYLNTDWDKSQFKDYKILLRKHYGRRQNRRCAYCRIQVNPDGYGNAIEHIVPRILKPQWMFVQYNLSVSCIGCNSSKNTRNTLTLHENNYGHQSNYCPNASGDYKIFNPHFDKWSDHFEIQDDFFLVPKPDTKGPITYSLCNLWRYQIVVDFVDQLNMRKKSFRSITKRIRKEKRLFVKEQLEIAKESIIEMIENN